MAIARRWSGSSSGSGVTSAIFCIRYRNVFGCFFSDYHGIANLDRVGVDNITFETDYPHMDSTWPHSKKVAEDLLAGLDRDTQYKILRGNAIRMLDLPAER